MYYNRFYRPCRRYRVRNRRYRYYNYRPYWYRRFYYYRPCYNYFPFGFPFCCPQNLISLGLAGSLLLGNALNSCRCRYFYR